MKKTENKKIASDLRNLQKQIAEDEYLNSIPSIANTKKMFHANKDCAEVREKVFKLLKTENFTFYCIVARKNESLFRRKFNFKKDKIYEYLVTKLLENRLHLYSEIDCYFSSMGNTVRIQNMNSAIQNAIHIFNQKWKTENKSNIRVLIQKTSEEPLLQAADYVLWTIQRAYERGEFRYYNFLQDKICLIHDIFDFGKYPQNYYSPKNPLEAKKNRPCVRLGCFRNAWHGARFHPTRIYVHGTPKSRICQMKPLPQRTGRKVPGMPPTGKEILIILRSTVYKA